MPSVRYEVRDRVAEILLDSAPVNALNEAMIDDVLAALRRAAQDDSVRAVILGSALPRRFLRRAAARCAAWGAAGPDLWLGRQAVQRAVRRAIQPGQAVHCRREWHRARRRHDARDLLRHDRRRRHGHLRLSGNRRRADARHPLHPPAACDWPSPGLRSAVHRTRVRRRRSHVPRTGQPRGARAGRHARGQGACADPVREIPRRRQDGAPGLHARQRQRLPARRRRGRGELRQCGGDGRREGRHRRVRGKTQAILAGLTVPASTIDINENGANACDS
ncbi:enoyl-CoA hydratase [Cupriavidus basilensis OR16]|uniref:Enoyl-CoA hydratase n=1 Tax=Cupriavidus basilensis OR16 TaxID=1127483 RepID=H1SCD9_9BURK|nr:enoyl-CoA hydratase [Cupriavidus basilensis OR16]